MLVSRVVRLTTEPRSCLMVEHRCRYLSFESVVFARSGAARRVFPTGSRRCIALMCVCSHVYVFELPVHVDRKLRVVRDSLPRHEVSSLVMFGISSGEVRDAEERVDRTCSCRREEVCRTRHCEPFAQRQFEIGSVHHHIAVT